MKLFSSIKNRVKIFTILSFIFLNSPQLLSQITEETYHKAEYFLSNSIQREIYHLEVIPNWLDSKTSFWYQTFTKDGKRFYYTDIEKGTTLEAFNHNEIAELLSEKSGQSVNSRSLTFNRIQLKYDGSVTFEWQKKIWTFQNSSLESTRSPEPKSRDTSISPDGN